ncbi:MAG TPA: RyR domain-containing protein [Bacillota bacterium]|nr:RyR domain-containing protein [Bacillota bacterium]HPL54471.1 RyR domain-containing protein [Bacillota bacterium]
MNDMRKCVEKFFDELEVFEDTERGHCYKIFMRQAIREFFDNETKETAFAVYRAFFDSYRITLKGSSNPFIDLLDVLKSYEENAAVLIDRQRDHYIHSVNVFLLGLSIYAGNARFRSAFEQTVMNKKEYPFSYDTRNEEFYYRWGLASLFHDVGYPVEIVGRQINKFIDFATAVGDKEKPVIVQLSFENFQELNRISEIIPKRVFTKCYFDHYEDSVYIDMLKPVDLLAHKLHTSLGVDLKDMKFALDDFVNVMARFGFIDHGYYSSIIVLKWYGYLIQSAKYKPEYFFWPVLDSASAILLHNCYKNMMMKKPFNLSALAPNTHPIAFLLILCDELQEWNRKAYGIKDKLRTLAAEAGLEVTDEKLTLTLITHNGSLPADFSREKKKLLFKLLDLDALFDGVAVHCKSVKKPVLPEPGDEITPRPELKDIEKLARAIHELYNEKQLERYPGKPLKYPGFDKLTDSLKYSNLRQAMDIPEKLRQMGFVMGPAGSDYPVRSIPEEYVEYLAEQEHEAWMAERIASGWVAGDHADAEKKTTPYLVPYDKLPEDIKQLDRDPVQNIPLLLERIGMAVYKK